MASKTEARPFLGYSDDPTAAQTSSAPSRSASPYHLDDEDLTPSRRAARGNRIARDLLIFLLASLLWLAAIFFLLPWPSTSSAVATSGQSQQSASSKPHHQLHGGGDPEVQAGSVAVDYRVHNVTSGSRWLSCGNSTAEARLAGCMYDELLNHWVPRRCASREWIDEYKDDDSWTAFAEYVKTTLLCLFPPSSCLPCGLLGSALQARSCVSFNSRESSRIVCRALLTSDNQRGTHAEDLARGHGQS